MPASTTTTPPPIRSEEVQEILTYVPIWMIRWGNTLILGLIIGFLVMAWFIRYPDVISAEVSITTTTPPEKIIARQAGKMSALLVADQDSVAAGQPLAVLENTAHYKDVLLLQKAIANTPTNYQQFYFPIEKIPQLALGEIEDDYALFERSYAEYILTKRLAPYSNDFLAEQTAINESNSRLDILESQKEIYEKELAVKRKDFERQKQLFETGLIAEKDLESIQLDMLQSERAFKNIISSISQLRESIGFSRKNLKGAEIQKALDENRLLKEVIQSYNQVKKAIKDWELSYLLKSSISGRVAFFNYWNENQTIRQDDLVFTVLPLEENNFIGKIKAPSKNSGKILKGQQVNIRLSNFPHYEFGLLEIEACQIV